MEGETIIMWIGNIILSVNHQDLALIISGATPACYTTCSSRKFSVAATIAAVADAIAPHLRMRLKSKVNTQSKESNQRVETSQSRDQRDEKSLKKLDGNFQRRESFSERKDDPTPVRKRPAFREKKIPVDSGEANLAVTVTVKSSHTDYPPRNERKEERSSNPNHLDRPEKQIAEDRAPNNREARRDGFSSRGRFGGSGGNSNYRGRDKFNGRQDYHPVKTQTEKWKHDLYQEVNKDSIVKNEDDQIAKLEALLAS
ncbi:hypothetical protein TSUD_47790 [Trifolium subterraneum]|nr:hypothetical protein TSUD_47790 [Trifolium subterraneum]